MAIGETTLSLGGYAPRYRSVGCKGTGRHLCLMQIRSSCLSGQPTPGLRSRLFSLQQPLVSVFRSNIGPRFFPFAHILSASLHTCAERISRAQVVHANGQRLRRSSSSSSSSFDVSTRSPRFTNHPSSDVSFRTWPNIRRYDIHLRRTR